MYFVSWLDVWLQSNTLAMFYFVKPCCFNVYEASLFVKRMVIFQMYELD
jgi:hypothetical protein